MADGSFEGRRRAAAGLWVSPVAGLSVGNSYWPAADVFGGRERGTQTSGWPSVTGLEEKEVVGQMGPVEAEGFDGSGDQLEGDGRSGPQEAPQWAANCGRITPGEWRPASSQVNQRNGDLHVRVAPVALDGNDAQCGLGSQGFVLLQ